MANPRFRYPPQRYGRSPPLVWGILFGIPRSSMGVGRPVGAGGYLWLPPQRYGRRSPSCGGSWGTAYGGKKGDYYVP